MGMSASDVFCVWTTGIFFRELCDGKYSCFGRYYAQKSKTVVGTVTDNGEPIRGASVVVKNAG